MKYLKTWKVKNMILGGWMEYLCSHKMHRNWKFWYLCNKGELTKEILGCFLCSAAILSLCIVQNKSWYS